jgi:hypothetical protein
LRDGKPLQEMVESSLGWAWCRRGALSKGSTGQGTAALAEVRPMIINFSVPRFDTLNFN